MSFVCVMAIPLRTNVLACSVVLRCRCDHEAGISYMYILRDKLLIHTSVFLLYMFPSHIALRAYFVAYVSAYDCIMRRCLVCAFAALVCTYLCTVV